MATELSKRLKAITRSKPIRTNSRKERDRTLPGKQRIKARRAAK